MKSFRLEWLLAVQVAMVVLSILGLSVLCVDASSRRLLPEGVTSVHHKNIEPAPAGSVFVEEDDPIELHQLEKEHVDVDSKTLETYRPRSRLPDRFRSKKVKIPARKETPSAAPPPPKNPRIKVQPPPPKP